jgi:hypothetical protein
MKDGYIVAVSEQFTHQRRSDETISADDEDSHKYLFQPILLPKFECYIVRRKDTGRCIRIQSGSTLESATWGGVANADTSLFMSYNL